MIFDIINDISILRRVFAKIYHQQTAQPDKPDKNVQFILGQIDIYYQTDNSCFQFDRELKNDGGNVEDDNTDITRLVNNAFAHIFKEIVILTKGGTEKESNKFFPRF